MNADAVVGASAVSMGQEGQGDVRYWLEWLRQERQVIDIRFGYSFFRTIFNGCRNAFSILFASPRFHGLVGCFPLPFVTALARL